jgi:hypothetical protein
MRALEKVLGAAIVAIFPYLPQASDTQKIDERKVNFIGVFHPIPTSMSPDRTRCPDPTHPLLITLRGQAFTTLGQVTFEQSHCEPPDHSSFRRGQETIAFNNGDQLFGTYSGLLLSTPTTSADRQLIIDGTYQSAGGTGRFKGADDQGIWVGTVNIDTGRAEIIARQTP